MTFGFVTLKLLRGILTLFLAVTFVFLILRFAGDPMRLMLPDDTPPDVLEHYRHVYGLDLPLPVQYLRYLQGLTQGEFGYSFRDQQPALDTVMSRVPATLLLGLVSFALSTIFGMVAGVIAALKRGSTVDHAVISFSIRPFNAELLSGHPDDPAIRHDLADPAQRRHGNAGPPGHAGVDAGRWRGRSDRALHAVIHAGSAQPALH